ncbi:MAG: response regulator [Planctomycetes bacterium]|nr:response regulator [Planctomycetota bacterium]
MIPKIMVVDDDQSVGNFLTRFLGKKNYEAISFAEPKKALEYLKTNQVNLMLADLNMTAAVGEPRPNGREISGIELIKLSKELKPNLQVLVMTGLPDSETFESLKKYGISDYLEKPIHLNDLEKSITVSLKRNIDNK